jgi:hypothetical protein
LLINLQLVTVGDEEYSLYTPPPPCATLLPENVQLDTVGEEYSLYTPPPQSAPLFENEQLDTVGDEE